MSQCLVALLLYRGSRICVGSLVTYVCLCGRITSPGFSVGWTSSSLSRVYLSRLSWHRSCLGHLWEAAVVWAPAYSAVYLCLCLAIKRSVLQYRVIFFTPWKHSRVPGYPIARVTASTNVDDTASLSLCQGIPQHSLYIFFSSKRGIDNTRLSLRVSVNDCLICPRKSWIISLHFPSKDGINGLLVFPPKPNSMASPIPLSKWVK